MGGSGASLGTGNGITKAGPANTMSAHNLQKGMYVSGDIRTPQVLDSKIITKRTYTSKGLKHISGQLLGPDGSVGFYDYTYSQQVPYRR